MLPKTAGVLKTWQVASVDAQRISRIQSDVKFDRGRTASRFGSFGSERMNMGFDRLGGFRYCGKPAVCFTPG
jgi:hypothetical protein